MFANESKTRSAIFKYGIIIYHYISSLHIKYVKIVNILSKCYHIMVVRFRAQRRSD